MALDRNINLTITSSGGGGSVLQTQAGQMVSGEWRQLTGANLPGGLGLFEGGTSGGMWISGASGSMVVYTDKFARDATNKRFHFVGSDHYNIDIVNGNPAGAYTPHVMYSDASNAWSFVGYVPWGSFPGNHVTPNHAYEHNVFDSTRGNFWKFRDGLWRRWDGGTNWSQNLADGNPYQGNLGAGEYFPEIDKLVYFDNENTPYASLWAVSPTGGTPTALVTMASHLLTPNSDYQQFCRYSALRQLIYFGGGNNASSGCWTYTAAGVLTKKDNMPLNINCGGQNPSTNHCFVNPANGNLVAYTRTAWYELNPTAAPGSQWTSKANPPNSTGAFMNSNYYDATSAYGTATCATEYGVVAFLKTFGTGNSAAEMWLWKP